MYQFDKVSNCAHDEESESNGLADFEKFTLVGLCTPVHELHAVFDEILRDIGQFLESL